LEHGAEALEMGDFSADRRSVAGSYDARNIIVKNWLAPVLTIGYISENGVNLMQASASAQDFETAPGAPGPEHRPRRLSEVGVRDSVLEDIALKTLYSAGPFSVIELAKKMHLGFEVANELYNRLRGKLLCEVVGMTRNVPQIAITSQGRSRALELLSQCQYYGSAPVSLASYVEQVRRQSVRNVQVRPADVERAFSHMVVDKKILAQFGTALNSGAPIFLYGPPGTGKTASAETLSRVLAEDEVWIPHAIEVDGQIITVYDPVIHRPATIAGPESRDDRWVLCHRPMVLVGGELTVEMLDLQFNTSTKYYDGPMQMKANNGVLIIDDLGRQRIRPEELLNRWVVPLDRRIEFLTMAGGRKIEIPFEMLVVFASNRNPTELMDPAFMRRIQTKIHIGAISKEQFREIFRRVAVDNELEVDLEMVDELVTLIRDEMKQDLIACHPRDLINQVCWSARYEGETPVLTRESLTRAIEAYFVQKD
jgi:predicted ATPase with chaperone activity